MNLLFLTLSALIVWTHGHYKQTLLYQWKIMNIAFVDEHYKNLSIKNGYFIPKNAVPFDIQPYYDQNKTLQVIVTVPRLRPGIPYTLATLHKTEEPLSGVLKPYSNYPQYNNKGKDCSAITSAMRVAINECNEMWVLDSGVEGLKQVCPPQLILFDLYTGDIKSRYILNKSLYASGFSLFNNMVVVVEDPPPNGSCKRSMVYVSDGDYRGLVVYDSMKKKAWRIDNIYMNADPDHGLLTIDGKTFLSMGGIFGMAANKKSLYFHPLASLTEYAVPLDVLNNRTLFKNNKNQMYQAFEPLGKRNSACAASAIDSKDNLYCVNFDPIELIKWNVNTPYNKDNFQKLPIYPSHLQFVGSMKVFKNAAGKEEIWMLSNKYQKIATGAQDMNEVNFRIVTYSDDVKDDDSSFVFPN